MIEALRRWLGRPRQPVIRSRQLLDWLEEASQGFLVLDRANRLQHLNGRARRLLGIGTEQVVKGRYLLEVVRCHQLEESVRKARSGDGRQRVSLSLIHISEPTRLLSISYAVFCLKKKKRM